MNKILKWIVIIIGTIIFLCVAAGIYITVNYEAIVKKIIVTELNKYIDNTEIAVGNINFSLLKNFPEASLEFINISAKFPRNFDRSSFPKLKDDTLFRAKSLSLSFNILDIFNNIYKIKQIEIKHGKTIILIDNKGKDNYHFWKSTSQKSFSPNFKLELNKLKFSDVKFEFQNLAKNLEIKAFTQSIELRGDFSSSSYSLSTSGKINLERLIIENVNYVNSGNISLKLNFDVNNNTYVIKKGEIKASDLTFLVSGKFISANPDLIDIRINGKNINIESFISLLPKNYQNYFRDYKSSGNFYFNASVSGKITRMITPNIEVKFGISNGIIEKYHSELKLRDINIEGLYNNGPGRNLLSSILRLNKFAAKLRASQIKGSCNIRNFTNPEILFESNVDLNLSEIQDFIHIDTIKSVTGNIQGNIKFSGKTKAIDNFTKEDFQNSVTEGKIKASNVNITFIKSTNSFTDITGVFSFKDNDLLIDSTKLKINKNDFYIKGYLKNIISYFMVDNEKLYAEAFIKSSSLNIQDFFSSDENKTDKNKSIPFIFPLNESFKIEFRIKHFVIDKFNAQNVSGFMDYNDKILIARNLYFETMDGKITANGNIKQSENNQFIMQWNSDIYNVDIKKLFYTFDNFGQTFILDKHLMGKVNATVDFSSEWSNNFDINDKTLIAKGNIEVLKGELINFEPMLKLSDFILLKELKHIKFSRLNNEIYIKDQKITIPQMTINSSAINIDLSGEQNFNYDISYHVQVLLSDLLSKNAKKAKRENDEFGIEEDDGSGKTNLFLLIKGNIDDYKVTYDIKSAKKNLKKNFEDEKVNLKTILHKEFGLFNKDSMVIKSENRKNQEKKKKKSNFTIEWDNDTLK